MDMRSQRSASFMKWVEMKIVTRSRRDSSISRRQKLSRATGSTPEVGSSRISSSGLCTMATASDRRWRMPSGRLSGRLAHSAGRSAEHLLDARGHLGRARGTARVQHQVLRTVSSP
jgi:hypothetical protein